MSDAPLPVTHESSLVTADAITAKPPATAVGTEDELGDRFITEALPTFQQWNDDIAKRIARAGTADAAASALDAWAQSAARDSAVVDAIYRASLMAAMGGGLQVRTVEVPEAASSRALARRVVLSPADGSMPDRPERGGGVAVSFLALPFEEAIADFRARGIVTPEQFRAMDAAARQRAFTAAGFATDSLRQHAYDAILSALENGETLAQFAREVRSGEQSLGITPQDPAYIETVFRTNIASAYGAGRVQQMQAPEVLAARPYVQIRAIVDGRTTSICRYLNGLTFDRRSDPGYSRYLPPNHFQCRTSTALLRTAQPSQLIRSSDVEERGQPAPGFDSKPELGLDA